MATTIANAVTTESDLESCENSGFNNTYFLIESTDVPLVSKFLQQYSVLVSELDNDFRSFLGERNLTITYYDYDGLELLNANKELIHLLNKNLPKYKSEREQINFIDSSSPHVNIKNFEVKYYNKTISSFDKHPLYSRIKRKERPLLIDALSAISHNKPESITESLKIEATDNVNYIMLYEVPYGEITLNRFTFSDFNIPNTHNLLKFEIYHGKQNQLMENEKRKLNSFFCQTTEQFKLQFPMIKPLSWFGYAEYNKMADMVLPSRAFFRKHPVAFLTGEIICLSLTGFLFLYLVLGRYKKRESYRQIIRLNRKK